MSQHAQIVYCGAKLTVSSFLIENDLWPFDMPLAAWNTFCGAGEGWGDALVPDTIHVVNISPACFQHDIDFCVSGRNWIAFMAANKRFRKNIVALTDAHLEGFHRYEAQVMAYAYYAAVTRLGWPSFCPDATPETWAESPAVKSKLHRLAMLNLQYDAPKEPTI